MSSDPEAIIYYGISLGHLDDSLYDANSRWRTLKIPSPSETGNYHSAAWNAWRQIADQWKKSLENIMIEFSGSDDYRTHYIHARALELTVSWDEQQSLSQHNFQPQPEADLHIKQFCEHFNLPYKQPEWHLAARYF